MSLKKIEPHLFLIFSLIILLISFSPFIYNLLNTPKNHIFTGAHNYPPDYMSYLSQIKTGLDGHLLYLNKFTTEAFSRPSISKLHFTLLGLLSRPFKAHPIFLYHFSRLILSVVYLFVIYYLIALFFKKPLERLGAFLLSIFTSSIPKVLSGNLSVYLPQYTNLDALFRATFLPHHLLRNLYLYLLFILFLKTTLSRQAISKKILILLPLLCFHLGLSSPQHSLIFLLTAYTFIGLNYLIQKKLPKQALSLLGLATPAVLLGVFVLNQSMSNTVGQVVKDWEVKGFNPPPPLSVFLALGPCFFLSIPSLLNKKTYQNKFLFLLVFVCLSLTLSIYPIEKHLPISHMRFLQIPLYPALGILAVQGIKIVSNRLLIPLIVLSILLSSPTYFFSFRRQTTYHIKNPTNFYIKRGELEALNFLDKNTQENEVILGNQFSGNLIPAFTGNRVYVGHILGTYIFSQKNKIAEDFFSGKLSQKDTLALFKNHQIKYIWFGELEAGYGTNLLKTYPYLNLKTIFQNRSVTIYQTQFEN